MLIVIIWDFIIYINVKMNIFGIDVRLWKSLKVLKNCVIDYEVDINYWGLCKIYECRNEDFWYCSEVIEIS